MEKNQGFICVFFGFQGWKPLAGEECDDPGHRPGYLSWLRAL